MDIIDYTPKAPTIKFADEAKALAEAGEGKAARIIGPQSDKTAFQAAAREAGFTARLVDATVIDEYTTEFIFVASPKRARKSPGETEVADAE